MGLIIVRRGVSGFVAFTMLLVLSSILAIYMYTYSVNLYPIYRPRQGYVYGYVVCYNVTGLSIVLPNNITVCKPGSQGFSSTLYLCIFRADLEMDLIIVYKNYTENLHINGSCVSLLGDRPIKFLGDSYGLSVVFEVRYHEPWSE